MLIDCVYLIPMFEQTTVEIHYSYHHWSWVVKITTIIKSPINSKIWQSQVLNEAKI